MSFTSGQRAFSWNVVVYGHDEFRDIQRMAGVYQRDGLLTIADIAHELHLCLVAEEPAAGWQPALLARDTDNLRPDAENLVILDQQNQESFPTPPPKGKISYDYVFHNSSECRHPAVEGCYSRHSIGGKKHLTVSACIAADSIQTHVSNVLL